MSQMSLPELEPLVLVWHWWVWGVLDSVHVICGRVTCPSQVAKPTPCSQAKSWGPVEQSSLLALASGESSSGEDLVGSFDKEGNIGTLKKQPRDKVLAVRKISGRGRTRYEEGGGKREEGGRRREEEDALGARFGDSLRE